VLITTYGLSTAEELSAGTRRLHKASLAHTTEWYRGWSDSKLAKIPPGELRRMKREERRRRKLQLRLRLNTGTAVTNQATAVTNRAPAAPVITEWHPADTETNATAEKAGSRNAVSNRVLDAIVPR